MQSSARKSLALKEECLSTVLVFNCLWNGKNVHFKEILYDKYILRNLILQMHSKEENIFNIIFNIKKTMSQRMSCHIN